MCEPMTMAAVAGGAGLVKTIFNFVGTQAAHHAAVQAANRNAAAKTEQLGRQNVQLSERQGEENLSDAVARAQSFGRIATSASALGLGASSAHQVLAAGAATYNRITGIRTRNYDNARAGLQTEAEGAEMQRQSEINKAPKANLLTLGMDLLDNAQSAASAYAGFGGKFGISKPVGGGGGGLSPQAFDWRGNQGAGVIY